LVAYLLNLRADVSLFSAPLAIANVSGGGNGTIAAPAQGVSTNAAPATNTPPTQGASTNAATAK
jgi:hypothetical protein